MVIMFKLVKSMAYIARQRPDLCEASVLLHGPAKHQGINPVEVGHFLGGGLRAFAPIQSTEGQMG